MSIQEEVQNDREPKIDGERKGKEHGIDDPSEKDDPLPDVGPSKAAQVLILLLDLINRRDLLLNVIFELEPYLFCILFNDL